MSRLLLVDLDHCVIASPRCDPTPEGIAAWERSIVQSPPPPVPGAIEGLRRKAQGFERVMYVTARSARLRNPTLEWLDAYRISFGFWLSMGHTEADSGGRIYKAARIARLSLGWPHVTLIDDDAEMRHALDESGTFLHAPGCWR